MDVRSQVSMVFHLDKCIGCHTCSVACKNVWTDREGTDYMWWNNVETKPGTGYPTKWEDQDSYKGGWVTDGEDLELRSTSKSKIIPNIFHNPAQPSMDDYYEPWTYKYEDLFNAPEGDDQPTARPVSMVTGEHIDVEAGPNWDDDLSGSEVYAKNDVNMDGLNQEQRAQMMAIERLAFFYLPRICNHCLNPSCVAACPSGALYKRGEDGIVLLNQDRCRAWRSCIPACPYKKTYFNWSTGKSEKCILCFPRLETGQAPACFHSCVGRIRYISNLLYDADKIRELALLPDDQLVEAQREMILDPHDPAVIEAAKKNGVHDGIIRTAQKSPVYKFLKEWKLALPLHVEYRTFPMLFYVPPLLPVMSSTQGDVVRNEVDELFGDIEKARAPIEYLGKMFTGGNLGKLRYALRKQLAVRIWRRFVTVGDISEDKAKAALAEADCTPEAADEIYRLSALATFDDRFVIPPFQREMAIEMLEDPHDHRSITGFGSRMAPKRS
ncbi:MAG: nitrate reductase subunit beta [Planctomycetes bacterium]|nr:nitrate reductase subunit beta [Planctomycetota bacterium]HJM57914.1 nitrate reductase subunit beta [Planctomycetota bacterium]